MGDGGAAIGATCGHAGATDEIAGDGEIDGGVVFFEVAMDEGEGFVTEPVPRRCVGDLGGLHRLIRLRQPLVIGGVLIEHLMRVEKFPQCLNTRKLAGEPIRGIAVGGQPLEQVLPS